MEMFTSENDLMDQWNSAPKTETNTSPDAQANASAHLRRAFANPAGAVSTVCQMLIGLGLALALIVKVYMLIFTDLACTADTTTLGNLLRCTGTLTILAQVVLIVAGFRLAAHLFVGGTLGLIEPLALAVAGAFLLAVSAATIPQGTNGTALGPVWQAALLILALFVALAAAFAGLHAVGRKGD